MRIEDRTGAAGTIGTVPARPKTLFANASNPMGNLTRRIAERWFPELSRLPDVSARNETLTTILHSYRVSRVIVFMFTPVLPFLITLPLRDVSRKAWTFWLVGLLFFGSFILAIMGCDLMVMMIHRGSIQ